MAVTQQTKPLARRPYLSGALFWLFFSLVAVLVRGVQWDENYEFAQVILGQIPYPEGHPLYQYVRGFYSLQTYTLAGLMYFFPGPLLANLLRNWLFLASSTVPVFLLGALFARRQLVGHVAAIFILLEVHVSFYTPYPIHVWPGVFSNGPVGLGYMLATLWALLDRRYGLAGLLFGLAPAIHLGQFPPVLAVFVLHGIYLAVTGRGSAVRRMLVHMLPGMAVCLVFALFLQQSAVPPPDSGPYFTPVEPAVLWHTYMAHHATHRAIPNTIGQLVLLLAVCTGTTLLVLRRQGIGMPAETPAPPLLESPRSWALIYALVVCFTIWSIMLVHTAMGPDIPFLLIGWLPYRLMNHVSPLLIPLLLAIGYDRDDRIPAYLPLLLLAALVAPLLHFVLPPAMATRYVDGNAFLYFLLVGAAAGTGLVLAARKGFRPAVGFGVAIALLLGLLAWWHQFGAACIGVGLLLACIAGTLRITERALQVSSVILACLILVAMLGVAQEERRTLPRSAFHQAVEAYLDRAGEPDALLLVPYMQVGEQMRFNHPVVADMATLLFVPYRPALAPAVNAVFQDFYGISLDPATPPADTDRAWFEVWPAKSLEEWQALSKKYGLQYIAAPDFMELPLEVVLHESRGTLYRIPPAARGAS